MPGPVSYPALPVAGGVVTGRAAIGMAAVPSGAGQVAQLYSVGPGADFGQAYFADPNNIDATAICGHMWGSAVGGTPVDQRWGGLGKFTSSDSHTYLFSCVGGIIFATGANRNTSGPSESVITFLRAFLDEAGRFTLSSSGQGFLTGARMSVWNPTAGEHILRLRESSGPLGTDALLRMEAFNGNGIISWTHAANGAELNIHNPSDGAIDFKLSRTAAGVLTISAGTVLLSGSTGLRVNQVQPVSAASPLSLLGNIAYSIGSFAVDFGADATVNVILEDASAGARVVTLPAAATRAGWRYTIVKKDSTANTVTIGGTVSGVTNRTLTAQYQFITVISDGTSWYQIG